MPAFLLSPSYRSITSRLPLARLPTSISLPFLASDHPRSSQGTAPPPSISRKGAVLGGLGGSFRSVSARWSGWSWRSLCSGAGRDSLEYDVVVVGAGPAGLSAAIRVKQLCRERGVDFSVCVVEKGAEVGAHVISGNVFEPRALDELLPQWRQDGVDFRYLQHFVPCAN